jgi:hypothetical protein
MNDTEQLSLSERVKSLEDIILAQHSQIQNLLEVSSGLALMVKTLKDTAEGHQRIFTSLHTLMLQKGLVEASELPDPPIY